MGGEKREGKERREERGGQGVEERQHSDPRPRLLLTSACIGFPNLPDNHPWEDNSKNPDRLEWCDPTAHSGPFKAFEEKWSAQRK